MTEAARDFLSTSPRTSDAGQGASTLPYSVCQEMLPAFFTKIQAQLTEAAAGHHPSPCSFLAVAAAPGPEPRL